MCHDAAGMGRSFSIQDRPIITHFTLCILMDYSFWLDFDTINQFICHGVSGYNFFKNVFCLKTFLTIY